MNIAVVIPALNEEEPIRDCPELSGDSRCIWLSYLVPPRK
jgi:hypothetical protein